MSENIFGLQFVGDRLEVNADGVAKLDRKRWSASGVKAIENCPAMWASDKLHPQPPDPFGAAELGTAAHKVLEVLYGLPGAERTEQRAMDILSTLHTDYADEVDAPEGAAELMRWRGEVATKANGVFALEDPTTVDVHGTEYKLLGEVAGVPMIGFVDRLDNLDGGVRVVDYKSGKVKHPNRWGDDHGDQIRLYAAALAGDGFEVRGGALYYIAGPEARDVGLTPHDTQRIVGDFVATYEEMKTSAEQGSYRTKASPLCGWCPLATVCPTAEANNRSTPKTDRAKLGTSLGVRTKVFTATPDVAHTKTITPKKRKRPMYLWSKKEESPWVATVGGDGTLNPNSYAAIGHCGNAALATELMMAHHNDLLAKKASGELVLDGDIVPPTVAEMEAMARTIDTIVRNTHRELTGGSDYNAAAGLSTRIRGALRSVIGYTPAPFGADRAAWDQWVTKVGKRIILVMDNAMDLHIGYETTTPWETLAR